MVNATYLFLFVQSQDESESSEITSRIRNVIRVRSLATLGLFAAAAILALKCPIGGIVLICICLVVYLRSEALVRTQITSTSS